MRSALLVIDFHDEASSFLKDLMLRCMMSSNFLEGSKKDNSNVEEAETDSSNNKKQSASNASAGGEGKRFLSHLFGLFPPFINELHLTVKVVLTHCYRIICHLTHLFSFLSKRLKSQT